MAGQQVFTMTQADRDLIQRFLDEKRRSSVNPVGRGREGVTEHEEWLTPEVYIAKIADVETGIPALVGSGGDADAVGFEGDEPGYADCTIYRILSESGTPKLRRVSSLPRRVYNIFPDAITDTPWIPVTRDKFGSWLAMGSVGAVGTGTDANEPPCGYLILDCPETVTECCDPFYLASTATLTYKIGSLPPMTLGLSQIGDGHTGTDTCDVGDGHTVVEIDYLSNCFPGYVAIGFSVIVRVDGDVENYVTWDIVLNIDEVNEGGYQTCDPYSLHWEGLNTDGVAVFTNPRTCGSVDYPFATAGGLLVTLDVVE